MCNCLHVSRVRSLEFRRRQPGGQRSVVGDGQRRPHGDSNLLRHAVVAERRLILVARLMVALFVVKILLFLPPTLRTSYEVVAGEYRERRYTGARERKMI